MGVKKSLEYRVLKYYWKLIQKDSRKLSPNAFYSRTFRETLISKEYLKRFSQSTFATYTSESKSNGMLMLKNDKSLSKIITSWIKEYL